MRGKFRELVDLNFHKLPEAALVLVVLVLFATGWNLSTQRAEARAAWCELVRAEGLGPSSAGAWVPASTPTQRARWHGWCEGRQKKR